MSGVGRRSGELSLLLAAAVFGVSTTVSVVALRVVRPVDLLAVEISGAAVMLVVVAAVRPSPLQLVGGAGILAGIALLLHRSAKPQPEPVLPMPELQEQR